MLLIHGYYVRSLRGAILKQMFIMGMGTLLRRNMHKNKSESESFYV